MVLNSPKCFWRSLSEISLLLPSSFLFCRSQSSKSKDFITQSLVPVPFPFARLNALQAAVKHFHSLSDPCLCWVTQAKQKLTAFKKLIEALKSKKDWMQWRFFAQLLVLIAIFLLASYANAFLNLNQVAGNQIWLNHLIRFKETNKQNSNANFDPIINLNGQTTNQRLEWDAELLNILSTKQKARIAFESASADWWRDHSKITKWFQCQFTNKLCILSSMQMLSTHEVTHLPWCYSLQSAHLVDCHVWLTLFRKKCRYFITSQAVLPDWQRVPNVSNHTRQAASSNW